MNSLVSLGCTGSLVAGSVALVAPGVGMASGFLEEPAMLLAFVLLGRNLETQARLKAQEDLGALARLLPTTARLVLGEEEEEEEKEKEKAHTTRMTSPTMEVSTELVQCGDFVRVLPGEKIPVDGVVVVGTGAVDESMLTGESRLVPKSSIEHHELGFEANRVVAGTILYEGAVTIRATSTGKDSTLAGIAGLVADAQSREAPVQR